MSSSRAEKKKNLSAMMKSTNGKVQSRRREVASVLCPKTGAETQKGAWEPPSFMLWNIYSCIYIRKLFPEKENLNISSSTTNEKK
jgi:hypothetical protein